MVHLLLLFSLVKKVDGPGFDYQVTLQLILGSRHDGLSLWEAHWVVQHVTLLSRQSLLDGIACLMCVPANQRCLQLGCANQTANLAHPPWHWQGHDDDDDDDEILVRQPVSEWGGTWALASCTTLPHPGFSLILCFSLLCFFIPGELWAGH